MILADTSAWVEYDRATESAVDQRITSLIRLRGPLAVTEPVVMEVVAGARSDDRESDLRRLLLRFDLLRFDAAADFDAAARIYRDCRRAGPTGTAAGRPGDLVSRGVRPPPSQDRRRPIVKRPRLRGA